MNVVRKKVSELHEAKLNSRYHSDRQIDEYVRSVKMFGQTKPIVADENGEVIIGNGLLKALQKMGATEADCYIVTGLSEVQKKKMMLSDNKIFELGMSLDEVMQDIVKEYKDVDIPGFSEDILSTIIESATETTKAIESYGVYPAENLSGIQKAANDEERKPLYTESATFQQTEETGKSFLQKHDNNDELKNPLTEKFIICPHCGQKIRI